MDLAVRKMPFEDTDKGHVLMNPQDMKALGVGEGDGVEIVSSRRCAVRVRSGDVRTGEMAADGVTRSNARTGVGEMVSVSPAQCQEAYQVTVSLAQMLPQHVQSILQPSAIKERLQGRIVGADDVVGMRVFSSRVLVTVVGVAPRGYAYVGQSTEIGLTPPETETYPLRFTTYEDIGGLDAEVEKVREMVEFPMRHPELFDRFGIEPPRGLLLWGPPGTGKTLVARALSSQLQVTFIHIDGPEVMHKYYGETERRLREVFSEASQKSPSIVFIDEIDAVAPKRSLVAGDVEKRVVAQLLALMDGMNTQSQVVVIGATNMPEMLDPALRRPGRFDREIYIGPPDSVGRHEILRIHARNMPLDSSVDLGLLGSLTAGFVGADLEILCKEAGMSALRRVRAAGQGRPVAVEMNDFLASMGTVQPAAARGLRFERSSTRLSDVAGMQSTKDRLRFVVENAMKIQGDLPEVRTVLLHGPSGNGKSTVVKALAGEFGLKFLEVTPAQILSGFPEKAVEDVFTASRRNVPCLVSFNRIDALTSAREGGQSLQAQIEHELETSSKVPGFLFVATSAAGKDLPGLPASTFDLELEVPAPDLDTRKELVRKFTSGLEMDDSLTVGSIAARTGGLTSGQVIAMCKKAFVLAAVEAKASGLGHGIASERHFDFVKEASLDDPKRRRIGDHDLVSGRGRGETCQENR